MSAPGTSPGTVRLSAEVRDALRAGRPVVALESSVLAQGLPVPANREAAVRMTAAVRRGGAVPAVTAVAGGVPAAGLEPDELERFLRRDGVAKVASRDVPVAMARRGDGATTVSASLLIARLSGLRVFATGGIGGVHREPAFDESADLVELARTPCVVVCAGAKSILHLPATMERLETLGVTVVGYRTSELPGFFTVGTGIPLPHRVETAAEIASVWEASCALGRPGAVLVVQPPPAAHALPAEVVEGAISRALDRARAEGVRGAAVTPFLLAAVERETGGRSLGANLALLESNAGLAAEIARALPPWEGQ
ncbi:MAG TPA: pseudouridine-5'-phosphate glycosidase [Gemmatimonadaceae bacterium]|nr:pseudouridine-5'-phosphate glycosidase [Gemmatimonadaceae bacterium]